MALNTGQQAPDFSLPSTKGGDFSLSKDMAGKPCILYFYPRDFSPACTQEACKFRDNMEEFRGLDIDVIGISRDSVASHHKFKESYKLPFELLADETGEVCEKYDVMIPIIRIAKRVTYLLDAEHRIVEVVDSMFNTSAHIKKLMAHLKA